MLVDNDVVRDSRVQKAARSAAAAGWDVTLLGVTTDDPRTWSIGAATARTARVEPLPRPRPRSFRRSLRHPLAYASDAHAERHAGRTALRHADRVFLAGAAPVAGRGPRWLARRGTGLLRLAQRRWVDLRRAQTAAKAVADMRISRLDELRYRLAHRRFGTRSWRRLEPYLWRYEVAVGPIIDELAPDLIHANDVRMLGVGARAVRRARLAGRGVKLLWDAHEYLPGMRQAGAEKRWLPAHLRYLDEYLPEVHAVVTVSEPIADLLQRDHALTERPAVLQNVPAFERPVTAADRQRYGDVRGLAGLGPDTPLLVYSGAAAAQRGLGTMVSALRLLPGVHLALAVGQSGHRYVARLMEQAVRQGVRKRVHLLPHVPHWYVVASLATADVGLIGNVHWPNHELSLNTKFFEYSHARLPLVTSDVATIAAMVQRTGQGEVFAAEDVEDLARAVRAVLADPARYRAVYDKSDVLVRWTWEEEVQVLLQRYRQLLGRGPAPLLPARRAPLTPADGAHAPGVAN
ncbi:glycosyltransferase family 4 protein [Pilimelia anulata]|nr:glycosyltransferase family 4 protein [Pilimelia anulata]